MFTEDISKSVMETKIGDLITISTVKLIQEDVFETCVFGGFYDQEISRAETISEAYKDHIIFCAMIALQL